MEKFIMFISLFLHFSISKIVSAACYTPNGTDHNVLEGRGVEDYRPCDTTAEFSMCCRLTDSTGPDICKENGFCWSNGYSSYWRESCTDPTWQSSSCLKLFVNGSGLDGTGPAVYLDESLNPVSDVMVTLCDNGSWCYGDKNRACCQQGQGVFLVDGVQTSKLPVSTQSSSTSFSTRLQDISASSSTSKSPESVSGSTKSQDVSTSPSTSKSPGAGPPFTDSSASLSDGAIAGLSVGAVGALLLVVGGLMVFRRKRNQSKRATHVARQSGNDRLAFPEKSELSGEGMKAELPTEATKRVPEIGQHHGDDRIAYELPVDSQRL